MSCASLVSVVIPTFNRARFIGETLESALSQTWKALEVIVVDDGSTDDTRQIVEEFAALDERVRYFHQANQGVSAARNHAIAQAQGEYVAFLDSDDLWHPWKLAIQMELLQAAPHVGMCWTNMDAISGTGELLSLNYLRKMYSAYSLLPDGKLFASLEPLGRHCPRIAPEFANTLCGIGTIYRQMFQGNLVHTPTVVIKTDWVRQIGPFDTAMRNGGEDFKFHLATCRLGEVAYIDAASILYRINLGDNITRPSNRIHFARSYVRTLHEELAEHGLESGLTRRERRAVVAESYDWLAHEEMETGKKLASLKHACQAVWNRGAIGQTWKTAVKCILPLRRRHLQSLKTWLRKGYGRVQPGLPADSRIVSKHS